MTILLLTLVMLAFTLAFSACGTTDDPGEPGPVSPKTPAEIMQLAADSFGDYMGRDVINIEGSGALTLSYSVLASKIGDFTVSEGAFPRNAPDIDAEGVYTADKKSRFMYSTAAMTLSGSFASLYPQGEVASMNTADNGVFAISSFAAAGVKQEQLLLSGTSGTNPGQIIKDNIDAVSIDALLPYAKDIKYKSEPPYINISFYVNGEDLAETFSPVTISIFTIDAIEKISFLITLTPEHELISQKVSAVFSGKIAENNIIPSLSGMTTRYTLALDLIYKDQKSGYSAAKIEAVENRLRSGESFFDIMTEYSPE